MLDVVRVAEELKTMVISPLIYLCFHLALSGLV